jgi:hypothetical protein
MKGNLVTLKGEGCCWAYIRVHIKGKEDYYADFFPSLGRHMGMQNHEVLESVKRGALASEGRCKVEEGGSRTAQHDVACNRDQCLSKKSDAAQFWGLEMREQSGSRCEAILF